MAVVSATNGPITIASATESQEDVNLAVGLSKDGKQPEVEPEAVETPSEAQAETAAESEPAEQQEAQEANEEPKEQRPRGKGGFQKRIDRLIREKRELEARLQTVSQQRETPQQPQVEGEPRLEQFQTYEAYIKAQARWQAKQELAESARAAEQNSQQEYMRELVSEYTQRVNDAREKYADWDEVSESLGNASVSPAMRQALLELEDGPDVVYAIASDPELLDKLNNMSDGRAIAELGRISASLQQRSSAPTRKPVSSAPAPIKPVGGGRATSQVPLDQMSMKDYAAARQAGRQR